MLTHGGNGVIMCDWSWEQYPRAGRRPGCRRRAELLTLAAGLSSAAPEVGMDEILLEFGPGAMHRNAGECK